MLGLIIIGLIIVGIISLRTWWLVHKLVRKSNLHVGASREMVDVLIENTKLLEKLKEKMCTK